MFQQELAPLGSLTGSALVALLPLLTIFVLLGGLRWKAHWAGLAALGVAIVVAVVAYGMPVGLAVLSATEGAVFGLFPIMWIVFTAIWLYQLTVVSGRFEDLRAAFHLISDDPRAQAIIIAFCFGGLLEALAGFGAPVAITSVMLVALGFQPLKAAVVALVANTAPVAFGAMGVPVITLARVTGLPLDQVASMVGRQTPLLALFVPLVLVFIVDGRRGVREAWVPAVACGVVFAIGQFLTSNFFSVELTDIVASLLGAIVVFALARIRPQAVWAARQSTVAAAGGPGTSAKPDSPTEVRKAYAPYVIIVVVFALAQLPGLKPLIDSLKIAFTWPFLDVVGIDGKPHSTTMFSLTWLSSAGTLMVVAGILTLAGLGWLLAKVAPGLVKSDREVAFRVDNARAFLSPVLGWLGVAVTGSDTSANALFGALQVTAAQGAGLPPELLAGANSSGGVLGKMLSPQNLTIAAAAVKLEGQEGVLLRKVIGWSLGMLVVLSVLIALQATPVLGWMLP